MKFIQDYVFNVKEDNAKLFCTSPGPSLYVWTYVLSSQLLAIISFNAPVVWPLHLRVSPQVYCWTYQSNFTNELQVCLTFDLTIGSMEEAIEAIKAMGITHDEQQIREVRVNHICKGKDVEKYELTQRGEG